MLRWLIGDYKCNNLLLAPYYIASTQLLDSFHSVDFDYVPRESNWEVDELVQVVSGVKMRKELTHKFIVIGKKNHPLRIRLEVISTNAIVVGDWRIKIREYLEDPNKQVSHRVKARSQNFVLLEREFYRKGPDGLLLRCLSFPDNMEVMKQVHDWVCGAYQAEIKM